MQDASRLNNTWFHHDTTSDVVVVFVHGFFSSADVCWKAKSGKFWPELVRDDSRIPAVSIFLGGYYTAFDSGAYSVRDCAIELLGALKRVDGSGRSPPLASRTIIFVCHSLGGIVVRYMLDAFRADFEQSCIGLCLMASPSMGSDYGTALSSLASFYKNRVGKALRSNNSALEDLDDRFQAYMSSRTDKNFFGAEAIEHHSPFLIKYFPDTFGPIVPKWSAARYFPVRETIGGSDHSTIVKPDGMTHRSHQFLVDLFERQKNLINAPSKKIAQESVKHGRQTDALFDVYNQSVEPYYIVRAVDAQLSSAFQVQSVWFSGPTGVGKTASLKRQASMTESAQIHVCLSQCVGDVSREALLLEIGTTIDQVCGSKFGDCSYGEVISRIHAIGADKKNVLICIDEVPSSGDGAKNQAANALLGLVVDILVTCKQRGQVSLRFAVSSLEGPGDPPQATRQKFAEHVALIPAHQWSEEDLLKLSGLICTSLPEIAEDEHGIAEIVAASGGSPRFVKAYFRAKWIGRGVATLTRSETIASVNEQMARK